MKRVKRYFLNAILLSAASVLMQSVTVSFNIYVSNRIGAEGMGLLTLIFTVTGLSVTVATSGIQLAVVKMTAEAIPYDVRTQTADQHARVHAILRAAISYASFFGVLAAILLFTLSRVLARHAIGDLRALPSHRVTVHGKEKIEGVFTSIPPHLTKDEAVFDDIDKLYIDTGLGERAKELVSVGDFVTYKKEALELLDGRVTIVDDALQRTAGIVLYVDFLPRDPDRTDRGLSLCGVGEEVNLLAAVGCGGELQRQAGILRVL
jgi:hypothetical protein